MNCSLPRILALLSTLILVINGAHAQVDLAGADALRDGGDVSLSLPDATPVSSPDDIYWDDRFTLDSLNITAIAAHGDELYVCGDFTSIGSLPARYIAIWNKRTREWSTLGGGLNRPATALAVQGDDLYVGGRFSMAGGDSTGPIARWSIGERRWYRLPALPLRSTVSAIAVDSAELYVATMESQSSDSGSQRMLARMKLGGDRWEVLPGDVHGYMITHLGLMGEYLYATGTFGDIAGVPGTRRVARWNRSSGIWSALGDSAPISGGSGRISALAVGNGSVYIGGSFDSVETSASKCLARWDTATGEWRDGGLAGEVTALAATHDSLYVGGTFEIPSRGDDRFQHLAMYTPVMWGVVPLVTFDVEGSRFDHITMTDSDLYLAGNIWRAGGVPIEKIGHYARRGTPGIWDAPSIERGLGIESFREADRMCVVGDRLCVMGTLIYRTGTINVTGIGSFNGEHWEGFDQPTSWIMTAIASYNAFTGPLLLVAHSPSGPDSTSLSFWDSYARRFVSMNIWGNISDLTQFGSELWCSGNLRLSPDDTTHVTVASWDGRAWRARKTDGQVGSMAATATDLYIGGYMPDPEGGPGSGLARWDGSRWRSVGGGVGGNFLTAPARVMALAVRGRDLYVAGEFIQEGSHGIARWDGTAWHGLGRGLTRPGSATFITSLAAHGRVLYAAGGFDSVTNGGQGAGDTIHAVATRNIARWDETTGQWSALGSGIDGTVYGLAMFGNDLYAVGDFMQAGGKPSARIALWRDPSPSASAPTLSANAVSAFSIQSSPNPATTMTTIGFTLRTPASARLSIVGNDGREIARLVDERLGAGDHAVVWDTRGVPGGVYFYRLRVGDRVESGSVVVIH